MITKDKELYRTFFPLLFVIALQQLVSLAVNMADNVMLGRYTELALSGATVANQVHFTLQNFVFGVGSGVAVLGAQYWGKQRTEPICRITSLGLKFGLLSGALFLAITLITPEGVLRLFTNDEAVVQEGARYLVIARWTYIIYALSNTLVFSLQSVETAFIGTVMSISTLCINICLNYCLIFGNFGFPELGVAGAAYATLTSRIVELIIVTVYMLFFEKKMRITLRQMLALDFTYLKDYVKISMPLVIAGALWGVTQAMQASILGHIDATSIAANSIANTIANVFMVVGMSSGSASSVTIGKTIGEGKMDKVKPYTVTLQLIFLGIGIICGVLIFALRRPIVSFYNISEETRQLTNTFLIILSVTTIGSCYEFPVQSGIITGGGNTKYPVIVENLFMWLMVLPSAFLSAFVFHFPPLVTFCCLKSDQVFKCIPNAIYCNTYKWVHQLTRDE